MCHGQLAQLRSKLDEFKDLGAQLLAIDPHEHWCARSLLKDAGFETDDLHYPLLVDPSLVVSATYGVAFQMRIHTEWSNRPATFVVDKAGILTYARLGTSFSDRPRAEEIVDELKRIQR